MLALTLTLITAVYILGPDLISRYILGFVVPRRTIQQTSSEEISRAIITAAIPLGLAVAWITLRHVVVWGAVKSDVQTYLAAILSQKFLDDHTPQFFQSAKTVARLFWAVAWRLYALLIVYATTINVLIIKYGELRNSKWMKKHPSCRSILAAFVLPRISSWHILLKSVSHPKSVDIRVDVMTKRDILYRGTVQELMLAPDGTLSGLLITKPFRYQREKFLDDLKKYSEGLKIEAKPNTDNYWKKIPGHAFLIMADDIETINLRSYERSDPELLNRLRQILNRELSAERSRNPATKSGPPNSARK
jgi:hypothetical protein